MSSPGHKKSSIFRRKKSKLNGDSVHDEKRSDSPDTSSENETVNFALPPQPHLPPVSFISLFRFATKLEMFLDFVGLIGAVASGAAQPLMSLLFGNLINSFIKFGTAEIESGYNFQNATVIADAAEFKRDAATDAAGLVYVGVGIFAATYLYMIIWTHNGEVMAKRVRERYLQAVLRQDIAFFDKVGAGEIATRIQTDTHLIQQGTSEKVALVVSFISAFITGFVLAYARSWRLALAITSILPCITLAGAGMNKFIGKYATLSRNSVADGGTLAEEVISTIRTAHAFGTQSILSSLYDKHVQIAAIYDAKSATANGVGLGLFYFIIWAAYALAFSFGATLVNKHEASPGVVINVFLSILIGSFSLALMAPELRAISLARGAASKLWDTIDRIPAIDSLSTEGMKPESVKGLIELEDVQFHYPSRSDVPILKGLSLIFEAGKTVALVGASGSGKSTIVSLVERFYDPISGVVKLDGCDLKTLNVKWLRSQIGLVSQEPTLFSTSIRGNVAQGLIGTEWEKSSEEEKFRLIKEACVKANADGFITKLPDGYDTLVGERGFLLSGGQKQRIAIARAIVSDPRILLLDEATSALDTQSEGIVQNALDKAAAGRTTITIAHRLSTIKDADKIYVMGEGQVLEWGTHNELLSHEGPYARLVQAQKLREVQQNQDQYDESKTEAGLGVEGNSEKAIQEEAEAEVPLGRRETGSRSVASDLLEKRRLEKGEVKPRELSLFALFVRLGRINREIWGTYALGFIFAVLTGLVYPASGIVYSGALTAFQSSDPHTVRFNADRNALWFFLIAIVASVATGLQNYLFANAAANLSFKLRSMAFKAILRQDIRFFDEEKNSTGALTANLSDNPEKVNGLAGVTLGVIVQSIACLVGGSIIGLIYSWRLALVGIACIPFVISTGYIRLQVVVLKDEKNKESHENSAQLACEAAASIRTVASLTREEECVALYSQSLETPLRDSNKNAIWSTMLFALSQGISFWVIALIFWYGSVLVAKGELTTKSFFVCLMSVTFSSIQSGNIFAFVPDISSAKGAANDLLNMFDSIPEIDAESTEGKIPQNVEGHIRLEDIHFRYPTRPGVRVLRELSIEVKPGTYIALVGASGCGKSTVIQLIERFYDPLAGRVYLDNQDVSELNVQEFRRHVALVSQEPTLYAGSIRFNILLGAAKPMEQVTQEEIELACRNANILDFIRSLPNGFDTEVGGKGSQLSGGQKQRIAIARALLRNPKVLLLDEATSALDSNSEKVVQAALDQAAKGRTTIAIAHRLSTIQNADRIYFIKEGKVSEAGTHDELISLQGGYYEYVQLQALSKK